MAIDNGFGGSGGQQKSLNKINKKTNNAERRDRPTDTCTDGHIFIIIDTCETLGAKYPAN